MACSYAATASRWLSRPWLVSTSWWQSSSASSRAVLAPTPRPLLDQLSLGPADALLDPAGRPLELHGVGDQAVAPGRHDERDAVPERRREQGLHLLGEGDLAGDRDDAGLVELGIGQELPAH